MRYVNFSVLFFIFFLGLSPTVAAENITGNDLLEFCTSQDPSDLRYCLGFIYGVKITYDLHNEYGNSSTMVIKSCSPSSWNAGQIKDIVVKYLRENPKDRSHHPTILVLAALTDAWPCLGKK